MRIGVFAPGSNKQARLLLNTINALQPGSAHFFDLKLEDPERCSMDAERLEWNGLDLASKNSGSRLDVAFLDGFNYCDPVIPAGDIEVDWSLWRYDYIADQQKYSFLYSALSELQRRGVKLVNQPDAHLRMYMKSAWLEQLRQARFNVPPTACTNMMEVASEFCARAGRVVWRPASGRGAWQLFLDRQRLALVSLQKPPILLAEVVDGPIVLGYVYDGKPLLFLQRAAPRTVPEEMLEEFWPVECPEATAELARLAQAFKLPWMQVQFVIKDGKPWIYDVDANPLYEGLPVEFRDFLLKQLAARLLGLDPPKATLAKEARQQRPTLFLRRMLDILFEFEQSKYS